MLAEQHCTVANQARMKGSETKWITKVIFPTAGCSAPLQMFGAAVQCFNVPLLEGDLVLMKLTCPGTKCKPSASSA